MPLNGHLLYVVLAIFGYGLAVVDSGFAGDVGLGLESFAGSKVSFGVFLTWNPLEVHLESSGADKGP